MAKYYLQTPDGVIYQTEYPDLLSDAVRLPAKAGREAYRQQCIANLRDVLPDGATVWCVLRSAAPSGMSRVIDFFVIADGSMCRLSHLIAGALDHAPQHKSRNGLAISGGGMDMGFHVVDGVARAIGRKINHRWL